MANKLHMHLQRWVRRSGFFLFTSAAAAPQAAAAHGAADTALVQQTQGLSHTLQGFVGPSINGPYPSFQGRGAHCLSALPSSSASSADERESDDEEGQEIGFTTRKTVMQRPHQLLVRSHSCSTLQGRQLVPSFIKSLLHHTKSHSHHNHSRHISPSYTGLGEQEAAEASSSEYTRSWSSPSLHSTRRHMIKLPDQESRRAFPRSRSADSCAMMTSRGKRAPKGHVAVYVEAGRERRVVPIAYLSHPEFEALLERAQSEFGFRQRGGLLIPCSLSELHHTLRRIHSDNSPASSCIHI